jgi:EAL domain-containing protein (putative c-di-GMP-specific phosphodiesterase class I)
MMKPYPARPGGRGVVYGLESPLAAATTFRDKGILGAVRRALARHDVLLAYQPVVYAADPERPAFYEGLIRILDENHRIIPAGDFMPAAENEEAGRLIDCYALELGLRALAEEPTLRLSINMSARSIGYPPWNETLRQGLAADPTAGERLILEITEHSAMLMPELVQVMMSELARDGITFALDDFGAGYTAFRYFKEFSFDILKIDGQFVRDIHRDANNQVLAQALVSIGRHFDMLTVAEAVEDAGEAAWLAEIGFDCLQGFYFGAPSVSAPWESAEAQSA